jgi:(2Fe-2S) ferredoxin
MAICRFGPKCDVFVDFGEEGRLECVACRLDDRATFRALDKEAMKAHLEEHIDAGHKVPDTVFEDIDQKAW